MNFVFMDFFYEFSTKYNFCSTYIQHTIFGCCFLKTIRLVRIFIKVCKNWSEICCWTRWTAHLMYSITEVIDCSVRRGTMNVSIAITMLLCAKVLICAHQVNGSKYLDKYLVVLIQIFNSNFVPSHDGTLRLLGPIMQCKKRPIYHEFLSCCRPSLYTVRQ